MSDAPLTLAEATQQLTAPGQIFETERATVLGREMTVWKHAPANLRQLLDASLAHSEKDFIVYEERRFTFDQHYRIAATVAQRLLDLGVAKGDRGAIAARNLPEWIMAFWGSVVMGAVSVPLNAWWTTNELLYGLTDSGSSVLFVDEERFERIRGELDALPALRTIVVMSEHLATPAPLGEVPSHVRVERFWDFVGDVAADATPPDVVIDTDDDLSIMYTSGTTGHPKGAMSTHRNSVSNLMNLGFAAQRAALRFGGAVTSRGQNAGLLNVPLFHTTGLHAFMVPSTAAGGKVVMMHHFDAAKALKIIEEEHIGLIGGVPTIAMQILDHPDFAKFDTSSVTSVSYGGAPPPPGLAQRLATAFPLASPGNGYGLTETTAAVCGNSGLDYLAKPDSCGVAYPINEVAILPYYIANLNIEFTYKQRTGKYAINRTIPTRRIIREYFVVSHDAKQLFN